MLGNVHAAMLMLVGAVTVLLVAQDHELKRLLADATQRDFKGRLRQEPVLLALLRRRSNQLHVLQRNDSALADRVLTAVRSDLSPLAESVEVLIRDGLTTDAVSGGKGVWGGASSSEGLFGVVSLVRPKQSSLEATQRDLAACLDKLQFLSYDVYLVSRRLHTDYGEYNGEATANWNPQRKRDWPSGQRSPYIITFSLFVKPPRFEKVSNTAWAEQHWFPIQSPMSDMMQPRARYSRNIVIKALSPNAPQWAGLVAESWPGQQHFENPFYFFNAHDPFSLVRNIVVMVRAVRVFTEITTLETMQLSEYLF